MLKVSAMAMEPRLWKTLPEELLCLVFAHLPAARIGHLRVLSKEWKRNIDCKDSEFNRVFDTSAHREMFALMSWTDEDGTFVSLYDMQTNKWHVFETIDYVPDFRTSTADGGLFCSPWQWQNRDWHFQIDVVNVLTQRKMKLPPLLSMGTRESDVRVEMVQLTMDRKTKDYKLHVVGYMKTGGNDRLFAQVYESHINGWSMMESREGRIIGWEHSGHPLYCKVPFVYNCADGNLQRFNLSDIAPGLTAEPDCTEVINDHLFVLHREAPPGSTNLREDGESISGKCCISEFHLPEKATAWVKLKVHKCDPSIHYSSKDYDLSLLACNGFLLVHSKEYQRDYDRVWLYNLSTCAWRNLPDLELGYCDDLVLCEISWSALP